MENKEKKNRRKIFKIVALIIFIIVIILLLLRSCGNGSGQKTEPVKEVTYSITFKNIDGTILKESDVKEGELPKYEGEEPKYSDEEYVYTFIGWDKEITTASSDEIYTATYDKEEIKQNEDQSSSVITNPVVTKENPVVTSPKAVSGLKYTAFPLELITSGSTTGGTLKYAVSNSEPDDSLYSTDIPKAKNAGTYKVWYKVFGNDMYNSTTASYIIVTIEKDNPAVISPKAIENLSYTGSDVNLINKGNTSGGTLKYAISDTEPNDSSYQEEIPIAKEIGTYKVWYKAFGDSNHNDSVASYLEVAISKANPTLPTVIDNLKYDGTSQLLLNSTCSVFEYKLEGGTYSNSIPEGLNAGDYIVYYRCPESTNYNTVEENKLTVTISKRIIEFTSASSTASINSVTVLTNSDVTISGDGFVGSHGATFDVTGSQIGIGTSYNEFTYTLTGGADESNYDITVIYGTLEITSDCLVKGTKITMADYSTKNIEDLKVGDMVLTFNHENATYEAQEVALVWKGEEEGCSFTLHFTNDINLSIVGDHALFSKEDLKYVGILRSNADEFIGKHFYNAISNSYEELLSVTYETELVEYYEIYTKYNANCVAESMLNTPLDNMERLNIYKFKADLSINHMKLRRDIRKYGLYEFEGFYDKEIFDSQGWKYVNIAIGKGLISSYDDFIARRDAFLSFVE